MSIRRLNGCCLSLDARLFDVVVAVVGVVTDQAKDGILPILDSKPSPGNLLPPVRHNHHDCSSDTSTNTIGDGMVKPKTGFCLSSNRHQQHNHHDSSTNTTRDDVIKPKTGFSQHPEVFTRLAWKADTFHRGVPHTPLAKHPSPDTPASGIPKAKVGLLQEHHPHELELTGMTTLGKE
ncbi:hypothetical protein BDB00DRAFT_880642 [Zychaea mexicana]|uniref:uncharacterized protein n=1 Tax=Zychaea mexicana TaxID=64656 RepID=UPI0022FF2035|nr:uncharacterized protein BDB00DRAFT_880642 [Zychaea mexicana]KAI9466454.1 hypothetical protein BDB00DRAFT_880642 [Zychaea mexicana]